MAYWGSRGRYHAVGLADPSRLPATKGQIDYLKRLDRRDYTGKGLTRGDASDLIEERLAFRAKNRESLNQMQEGVIEAMWHMSIQAANNVGKQWLAEHTTVQFPYFDTESKEVVPVYGAVGSAWLTWPDKGSPFYKWLKEKGFSQARSNILYIPHRYADRLEGGLLAECAKAVLTTFANGSFAPGMTMMVMSDSKDPRQAA